jgi:hypothetical protein
MSKKVDIKQSKIFRSEHAMDFSCAGMFDEEVALNNSDSYDKES